MITLDPEVKEESIWPAGSKRRRLVLDRNGPSAWLRNEILRWRSYHHFRTDAESPLRQPQIGALSEAIGGAFGGAELYIDGGDTQFSMRLRTPGLLRPVGAREFSDGQLRFLCLCAGLLSPRPPSLPALNEPETSLHPDLIDPLARLIVRVEGHAAMDQDALAGAGRED